LNKLFPTAAAGAITPTSTATIAPAGWGGIIT
jgi:hypothetical protein